MGVASTGMDPLGSLELECEPAVHAGSGFGFGRVAAALRSQDRG